MKVDAEAAVAVETGELLRRDVVARKGERHDVGTALPGKEELATVGMVVGMPYQYTRAIGRRGGFRCFVGIPAPADQIAVADRVIAAVENLALPVERKGALGGAALISRIGIDRPPALRRPPHDLDLG